MQGLPVTRTSIQFEVQALRGTRWVIELVSADGAAALERGRQLLQRADIDGVKVWQEVHDRSTGPHRGAGSCWRRPSRSRSGAGAFVTDHHWHRPPAHPPQSPQVGGSQHHRRVAVTAAWRW